MRHDMIATENRRVEFLMVNLPWLTVHLVCSRFYWYVENPFDMFQADDSNIYIAPFWGLVPLCA